MPDLFDRLPDRPAPTRPEAPAYPCPGPANGGYVCRIGGGAASMSDNGGVSWFCPVHRPARFYPHERGQA